MALQNELIKRVDRLIKKAELLLETYKPPVVSRHGFVATSKPKRGDFSEWHGQSLSFLVSLLENEHTYVKLFSEKVNAPTWPDVETGLGILRAVREEIKRGYLTRIRRLVEAELFSDFLTMALHLLDMGYHIPAASLTGAVLEDGLRKIAVAQGIPLKPKEAVNSLNQECYKAGVYSLLVQKNIQVWAEIRNKADHGHFDKFTKDDVGDMLKGVTSFLADNLK